METQPGDRPDNTPDVPAIPLHEDPDMQARDALRRRQQRVDAATIAGATLTAHAQLRPQG